MPLTSTLDPPTLVSHWYQLTSESKLLPVEAEPSLDTPLRRSEDPERARVGLMGNGDVRSSWFSIVMVPVQLFKSL